MVLPPALAGLESAIFEACSSRQQWPFQVAAGIYAGVDFATANPATVAELDAGLGSNRDKYQVYEELIGRLTALLRSRAPLERRLPGATDRALVGGLVGIVGDNLRIGRSDRIADLRADLVLMALLPYLGFDEARRWANLADRELGKA